MDVPIYIDGREAGRLRAEREGLYTRLRAECGMRGGLTRLWLHGGGQSRYLGLLAPEGGQLRLEKRLSRASLPPEIEYASDAEKAPSAPAGRAGVAAPETESEKTSPGHCEEQSDVAIRISADKESESPQAASGLRDDREGGIAPESAAPGKASPPAGEKLSPQATDEGGLPIVGALIRHGFAVPPSHVRLTA